LLSPETKPRNRTRRSAPMSARRRTLPAPPTNSPSWLTLRDRGVIHRKPTSSRQGQDPLGSRL